MFALIIILALTTTAEDSSKPVKLEPISDFLPELIVTIETAEIRPGEDSVSFDIRCNTNNSPIGGFELTIECRSRVVDIMRIEQGTFQDSCVWEQFNARRKDHPDYQRWHIVSLASLGSVDTMRCLTPDSQLSIATITARVKRPAFYTDTLHAVYFTWARCSDNSFSDSTGSRLMIGEVEQWGLPVEWLADDRPAGFSGPPEDCFRKVPRPPLKAIKFRNGGVVIRSEIEPPPKDSTAEIDSVQPVRTD